jgi:Na+/melibiose symporter-like transporter
MNRLEKRAWATLGGMLLCAIIAGPGVAIMVHLNMQAGLSGLILFFAIGLIVGLITRRQNIKSWAQLDEREKKILQKAIVWSMSAFILFMFCVSFAVFYIVGAKNPVPAYFLPAMFLSGLFLMILVQSAVVLIQFAKERRDE